MWQNQVAGLDQKAVYEKLLPVGRTHQSAQSRDPLMTQQSRAAQKAARGAQRVWAVRVDLPLPPDGDLLKKKEKPISSVIILNLYYFNLT